MWAAAENNGAAVRALTRAGADLNMRSHGPLAARQNNETANDLNSFSGYYSREGRIDSFTPLLFAVWAGQIDSASALLNAGANPNDAGDDGTSALVIAAANAHWDAAALLLDFGADPNAMAQGWSALHQVTRWRSLEYGRVPIPIPTGKLSHLDLVEKLIKAGADVNARVKKRMENYALDRGRFVQIGATPLLLAAKGFDARLMRLLIAHGADPSAKNALGSTVLMAAAGCETSNPGTDSGSPVDALEAVKVALEWEGADVNAVNSRGDTALHGAAMIGADAIALLLIEQGARLDIKNKENMTPLAVAHLTVSGDGFHSQPETAALLRRMMTERGLPIEVKTAEDFRAEREKRRSPGDEVDAPPLAPGLVTSPGR
jgi:ankyrin repeat protein